MNIAIVDDVKEIRQNIKMLTYEYFNNKLNIKPNISQHASGEEFIDNYAKGDIDIAILDIYMGELTGFELAKKIRKIDSECKIIFVTSSADYILEGYEVHACGYILKPIHENKTRLYKSLAYAIDLLNVDNKSITVSSKLSDFDVLYKSIVYADIETKNVILHLEGKNLKLNDSFKYISGKLLNDNRFVKCYRNLIINMDYIEEVLENDFVMIGGEKLPISRRMKKDVMISYTEFFLNGGN